MGSDIKALRWNFFLRTCSIPAQNYSDWHGMFLTKETDRSGFHTGHVCCSPNRSVISFPVSAAGFRLTWFYSAPELLRSSCVIINVDGECIATNHILFSLFLCFYAQWGTSCLQRPTTFPCHSWYVCFAETKNFLIC